MSYCYNNNVSNCYTICKEVKIVLTVTKVQLMREITDFNYPPFSFAFENFEEKKRKSKEMTKTQGQKKDVNIRIQKSYSNIWNEYEYSNIRISVDILSMKFHNASLYGLKVIERT